MTKKRKSSDKTKDSGVTGKSKLEDDHHDQADREDVTDVHGESDSDSDSSSDDSLVLEGKLIRNPDVSVTDDDSVSSEDDDEKSNDDEPEEKKAKHQNDNGNASKAKKKDIKSRNEPEMVQVEFQFCDMNEKFFHGLKTLLHRHGIHAPHSSQLADLIIENISVGTVLSTDYNPKAKVSKPDASSTPSNEDPNVFGFASVINLTTYNSNPCITSLKNLCLHHCPSQHKSELETVLSGKTKRPAGFFFHERMVNVPLEITEVLHQQLVLDMDWAVDNAEGGEEQRKSLDFGAFVRMAPCYNSNENLIYKYFDDEVFATHAEFVFTFEIPKLYEADEQEGVCSVIILTKTGHRAAMKDLGKMIGGN